MAWRTAHFTLSEFTRSATAEKLGIDNTPTEKEVLNLCVLAAQVLEPARRIINKPFIINSGYRCEALNKAVGGQKNSYHLKGMAADISCSNDTEAKIFAREIVKAPLCDLCIIEHKGAVVWLHVQFRYENARQLVLEKTIR